MVQFIFKLSVRFPVLCALYPEQVLYPAGAALYPGLLYPVSGTGALYPGLCPVYPDSGFNQSSTIACLSTPSMLAKLTFKKE